MFTSDSCWQAQPCSPYFNYQEHLTLFPLLKTAPHGFEDIARSWSPLSFWLLLIIRFMDSLFLCPFLRYWFSSGLHFLPFTLLTPRVLRQSLPSPCGCPSGTQLSMSRYECVLSTPSSRIKTCLCSVHCTTALPVVQVSHGHFLLPLQSFKI